MTLFQTVDPGDGSSSYTITVTKTGSGYVEPTGTTVTVQAGENRTFSFMSDPLLRLALSANVQAGPANGTMVNKGAVTSYTFSSVNQDMKLNVAFDGSSPVTPSGDYRISVYTDGSGTVSPAGPVSVDAGASQTFTFTPGSGAEVDYITYGVAGKPRTTINGPVSNYTFTNVQDNMELGVVFTQVSGTTSHTISVSKDGSGTVLPAGPVSVVAGGSQTFTFTPDAGWKVSDVTYGLVGGTKTSVGAVSSYTFSNVQNNMELGVVFTESSVTSMYDADGTFPIYYIPVQVGQILDFTPILNFAAPPEGVSDYYVGYISQGKLFMARQELNGNIVFDLYGADQGLLRCGTYDFQGGATWECGIFQKAQFQTDLVAFPNVDCLVVGVGEKDDLSTLQGAIFQFVAQ